MTRGNIRLFWGFWIVLGLLWLALNTAIFSAENFFALRQFVMQFSGVLAISAMSVAMVLSLRPRWPEARLGGLDKMYKLHKWLGIGALCVAIFHWLWSEAPKWAVGFGLLAPPVRGPRPEITDPLRRLLGSFRGTAEEIGQWAFYAAVVLLLIALIKLIPYHWFRYSHRFVPAAYLALVFHAIILLDYGMWLTPLGLVVAVLLLAGSYAAAVSILGRIGAGRRVTGEIAELRHYPGVRSLETVIKLGSGWPGHEAGQFAFATSNALEGAHPYTIASAWNPANPTITFISKELGDHTTGLVDRLKIGQTITVEGPYGRFTFDDGRQRQIWIGAGIGITPFVARLKELATLEPHEARPEIDLFHTTREVDEAALERLARDAHAAKVRLHTLIDSRHGRLSGERIREMVPGWQDASIWFCGPIKFGAVLKADFATTGMPIDEQFHQELFELR
ncbi:bifunctional nitric oxide dioxygenase/dihydropteridine reductase 2 [Hartmannibacter diazotrophicus]|uniref:Bifunctional nitric oxide dioxygenase/dihydropteridine reductase 2 n=1 Tax=Hartmannibacter diazotrophicus TaxID=1482074 RepID=A0A2C9D113_9HYPH|nr:ferric reductase-like transmembrane domain-containing protein [Hartmannibacter diazotrophicus]SON53858.1 bifunctional nitric oxide dioxygenase/dihydropteridine reductase 2 [Hartmannibacter diazotrophicus]